MVEIIDGYDAYKNHQDDLREIKDLREEVEHLRKGIRDALDLANGRYFEWGDRAIMAFKVLEGLIEEEEDEETES